MLDGTAAVADSRNQDATMISYAFGPCCAVHLFGGFGGVVHPADALLRGQAQLLDQQSQIDAEFRGRFDAAPGTRMAQPIFRAGDPIWRWVVPFMNTPSSLLA